jgi:peroxiredoxin Q/BCP
MSIASPSPTAGTASPVSAENARTGAAAAVAMTAPDFSAAVTQGDETDAATGLLTLSALRGKHVVLFFYPKDGTPGCTKESMAFRDLSPAFAEANAVIVGVSRDSLPSHERFKAKLELPFGLVSDKDEAVCALYGVMKEKKMYGKTVRGIERSTFVIDAEGKIRNAWRGLKVDSHADDVLAAVQTLESSR